MLAPHKHFIVQSQYQKHKKDFEVALVSLLLWIYFTPFSNVSTVDFEQVESCSARGLYNIFCGVTNRIAFSIKHIN